MSDNILLIVFGSLTLVGIAVGAIGVYFAVRNARKPDGELRMAFWSFFALAGLTFGGMCAAYFLLPILANHLFR